jgi:hypothetical protein
MMIIPEGRFSRRRHKYAWVPAKPHSWCTVLYNPNNRRHHISQPLVNKEKNYQPMENKDKKYLECGMLNIKCAMLYVIHIYERSGKF